MTRKWPTLSGRIRQVATLVHAQAWAGNPDLHSHPITITFGWRHEINPHHGHTWSIYESQAKVAKLIALIDGKNFNDLIPAGVNPTIETMACWLLVRADLFDYVEIDAYDNYTVHVDKADIPKAWRETYLAGDRTQDLTV